MKRIYLITLFALMTVHLGSCKKLLGKDDESLLTKDPWIGDEMVSKVSGQSQTTDISSKTVEFNKKTDRYVIYDNGNEIETGDWAYDKKSKILSLEPDDDLPESYDVIELTKDRLHLRQEGTRYGVSYSIDIYYVR